MRRLLFHFFPPPFFPPLPLPYIPRAPNSIAFVRQQMPRYSITKGTDKFQDVLRVRTHVSNFLSVISTRNLKSVGRPRCKL